MSISQTIECDILIAGAGFAGSLTALALHQSGFEVCLVEKHQHPRFAIGESSTPIADMVLRDFSGRYDLPWLDDFSRYGTWQHAHPEIICGIKRGFSYYKHTPLEPFTTDASHSGELLVAASSNNQNSDTNWLRSDFDAFLVEKVKEYGITCFENTEITGCDRHSGWKFKADNPEGPLSLFSEYFIDATGGPALLKNLIGVQNTSGNFRTNSSALYSHFEDVRHWSDLLKQMGISDADYPYDPDYSALHHLLEEGWIWMLRFNNNRTSIGIVLNQNSGAKTAKRNGNSLWESVISAYPSVQKLLHNSCLSDLPGKIIGTGRLQRKLSKGCGTGWVALPHTIGFVDPLHSTGIAHTLCGVEKVVSILAEHRKNDQPPEQKLKKYEQVVFSELNFIDLLVSGCYDALHNFELFSIWSMLYFTAAVTYEQQRLKGERPNHFLLAGDAEMKQIVNNSYQELKKLTAMENPTDMAIQQFRDRVRKRIKPYNIAGLLEPDARNMYYHTAVEL